MSRSTIVKARSGLAFAVQAGERFRVIDVDGEQVSDVVAFVSETCPSASRKPTRASSTAC